MQHALVLTRRRRRVITWLLCDVSCPTRRCSSRWAQSLTDFASRPARMNPIESFRDLCTPPGKLIRLVGTVAILGAMSASAQTAPSSAATRTVIWRAQPFRSVAAGPQPRLARLRCSRTREPRRAQRR